MRLAADLIPISALQHYLYCPRQCALIHLEQIWMESVHTAEGRIMHEKVHGGTAETRGDIRSVTGLPLRSLALGLTGQADVVEFHRRDGLWHPYPVEYKRGRPKSMDADRIQLCAQALCLEEMLGRAVPLMGERGGADAASAVVAGVVTTPGRKKSVCAAVISGGALFYGKTRRRQIVVFDDALREATRRAATSVHELFRTERTPPPPALEIVNAICPACSLRDACLPLPLARGHSAARYLENLLEGV